MPCIVTRSFKQKPKDLAMKFQEEIRDVRLKIVNGSVVFRKALIEKSVWKQDIVEETFLVSEIAQTRLSPYAFSSAFIDLPKGDFFRAR